MRFSTLLFAAFAALATAQNFGDEPQCAVSPPQSIPKTTTSSSELLLINLLSQKDCLAPAISRSGCAVTDTGCQCSSQGMAAIQAAGQSCLLGSCNSTELASALMVGQQLCALYSSTAGLASGSTNTNSQASTTGDTLVPQTTFPSSGASTVVASTTTVASGSTTGSGSTAKATTGSGTSTSAKASSTSSVSQAGAAHIGVGAGGVLGLVLGGLAAL